MEWNKIRRLVSNVAELARLLPDDSPSRLAVFDGKHYWEEIIAIVEMEMKREEEWGNVEELYWERLKELLAPLCELEKYWKTLIYPEGAFVPLKDQGTLTQMFNLRRRRSFELA